MGQCGGNKLIQRKAKITDTFIETSLFISKETFHSLHKEFDLRCNMDVHSVSLDYAPYKKRLDRLGSPWAWEKRPKYQDQQAIEERISDPRSKLFDLTIDHKDVGYCLVVPRDDLSEKFGVCVSEIENFAIEIDYNGQGYGSPFFKHVCKDVFSNYAEAIFLSTRSTNHDKVLPFYERLGMKIIKQEVMINDLK